MAKITVDSGAVMYDGRLLYKGTAVYSVNDTYENYLQSLKDVANSKITVTEPFTNVVNMGDQYLSVEADFSSASWNTVATHEIFTVTGAVELEIIAECTKDVTSGGSATICLGVEGATNAFIADTVFSLIDVGEVWDTAVDGTTTKYGAATAMGLAKQRIFGGLDVGYEVKTAALTDGKIKFHCFWKPLNSTGAVAAGTGVALS